MPVVTEIGKWIDNKDVNDGTSAPLRGSSGLVSVCSVNTLSGGRDSRSFVCRTGCLPLVLNRLQIKVACQKDSEVGTQHKAKQTEVDKTS